MRTLFIAAGFLLSVAMAGEAQPAGASQPASAEQGAVLNVVQRFFDAMAARDPAALQEVTVPEGRFFALVDDNGQPSMRSSTNEEFTKSLAAGTEALLERMWNPEVRIHGRIATVWVPYDFYRGRAFSHCGIDAFNLVKTPSGWKISGGVYTVERTGCPPSPLGPPKK